MILEVRGLCKNFGGLDAISTLDFNLEDGEIRGLIGPNGAGKTTFFSVISGYYKPSSGGIRFSSKDIVGLKPNQITKLGMVRTFQMTTLFQGMTVHQHVSLGVHNHLKSNFFSTLFHTPFYLREQREIANKTVELLEFIGLDNLKDELAENLPHGYQRALAIATALAAKPSLLLLDEPVTGMNPIETTDMVNRIRKIRDEMGITIIVVEHDMKAVIGLCDRLTVLNYGVKIAEGPPKEVIKDGEVIEAYLGAVED